MIHHAKKSLGQHFLTSKKVVEKMAALAHLSANDTALEIGPGKGVLTRALLATGATVIAVEKDRDLIAQLHETFADEIAKKKLTIIEGDILKFEPSSYKLRANRYKLIANIPYYITGEIIRRFLSETVQPESMILLVQKEVAERIAARSERSRRAKNGKPLDFARGKESILSLSVKLYGTPRIALRVPKKLFSPVPKIDSAVICIERIGNSSLSHDEEKRYFQIVKKGFSQKRKQVVPLLTSLIKKEELLQLFATHQISPNVRAEDLPLEVWKELATRKAS